MSAPKTNPNSQIKNQVSVHESSPVTSEGTIRERPGDEPDVPPDIEDQDKPE